MIYTQNVRMQNCQGITMDLCFWYFGPLIFLVFIFLPFCLFTNLPTYVLQMLMHVTDTRSYTVCNTHVGAIQLNIPGIKNICSN